MPTNLTPVQGTPEPLEIQLALAVLIKEYRDDSIFDCPIYPGLKNHIHRIGNAVYRVRVDRLPDEPDVHQLVEGCSEMESAARDLFGELFVFDALKKQLTPEVRRAAHRLQDAYNALSRARLSAPPAAPGDKGE